MRVVASESRGSRVVGTRSPQPKSVPIAGGMTDTADPVVHCVGSVPSESVGGEQWKGLRGVSNDDESVLSIHPQTNLRKC